MLIVENVCFCQRNSFRRIWPVDQYGKWAEHEYDSVTYPPFACGSGYVLGRSLMDFVVKNKETLHAFQGEDVSLGIWLSSIHPDMHHDDRWLCSKRDVRNNKDFISLPDLDGNDMERVNDWKQSSKKKHQQPP